MNTKIFHISNKSPKGRGVISPVFFLFSILISAIFLFALVLSPFEASAEQDAKEKADTLLKEASSLYNEGNMDKALTNVKEAIAIFPEYPEAYDQLGYVLLKKGQLDDAINAFNSALKINPRFRTSKTGIGLALLKKGDTSGAETILKEALTLNPYPSMTHYALGLVYEKLNDYDNSTAQFKEGIKSYKSGKR
jgi:Tfp pilus assembly protein PilF